MDCRTKELRAMTPLDMGGLLPEIMWIPMAVILKERRSVIRSYNIIHNCAAMQYLSIWHVLKMLKFYD
ncbi:hypothetical protein [Petroclostridium xylanilyticum]|jgi:hypothetical protein|uniref:hypothetical protein n=1 Tax=Petroclostridium xylanilyticum TaxID=1792311 RepID=UPI000B99B5C8|nr:hypothetical protein [Petroclostridium xylanilyticum]